MNRGSDAQPVAELASRGLPRRRKGWGILRLTGRVVPVLAGLACGGAFVYELETSALQSRLFAHYVNRLSHHLEAGPSKEISFPAGGPFNERRGYPRFPEFVRRLGERGFAVSEQVRMSPELQRLVSWGVEPPDREPDATGLIIRGRRGELLYDGQERDRVFRDYSDIPPLVVQTLLFIENQELLSAEDPRSNPTLEWDRLGMASLRYFGAKLGLPVSVQGGSTLATQLEKFRHSPDGRTSSPQEKLRQITSASLKAYRDGLDTTARRREIVVEYLNSMPLAAAPGYGEVYGLGDGLHAWFGMSLPEVAAELSSGTNTASLAVGYKHVLALLASLPAPSSFLGRHRDALERRMDGYLTLMEQRGVLSPELAKATRAVPLVFLHRAPQPPARDFVERKASTAVRTALLDMLGVSSLYELAQLHLEVDSTFDMALQLRVAEFFRNLGRKDFVAANGLLGKNLLTGSDPAKVLYSMLLYERTAEGNLLRVQADSLNAPFDLNRGGKMELGSTAKLRTLAHYLELVATLYDELLPLDQATLRIRERAARDPITQWAAATLAERPNLPLDEMLDLALERKYSANPGEAFFTGGGQQTFANFDRLDNNRNPSVRDALHHSVNLSFIRLMRDLVRFHRARLPYDTDLILEDPNDPERKRMLDEIVEDESRTALARAYQKYHGAPPDAALDLLLESKRHSSRHLAILFYAWHPGGDRAGLAHWLAENQGSTDEAEVTRLVRAYGNPSLTLADYGYLLSIHPLDVWSVGQLIREPELAWDELLARSAAARRNAWSWIYKPRNRRPQERRLRVRIEHDAFARMTPYWQRFGFPFDRLVASYATAIGSSGDKPAGLATLMGIIVNDGLRRPNLTLSEVRFGRGTPYESAMRPAAAQGEQVMHAEVARALRGALTGVVEKGTARRVYGAFVHTDGHVAVVGGKTGTGDNRYKTFTRWGAVRSSRAINRTATFVFFIDDHYFGVLTAFVPGRDAEQYHFTSSLPLTALKLLAPAINPRLDTAAQAAGAATEAPVG